MQIGVIADTHLAHPTPDLLDIVQLVFDKASLILHAGDLTRLEVLKAFTGKEVIAVRGNRDCNEVKKHLPEKETIEIMGYRIGLMHGSGPPWGIEKRVMGQFEHVHAIIYGHTHRQVNHIRNGVLLFNPGAYSGSAFLGKHRSVGLLTLNDRLVGTHIALQPPSRRFSELQKTKR